MSVFDGYVFVVSLSLLLTYLIDTQLLVNESNLDYANIALFLVFSMFSNIIFDLSTIVDPLILFGFIFILRITNVE